MASKILCFKSEFIVKLLHSTSKVLGKHCPATTPSPCVRNYIPKLEWTDWRMQKDAKRRTIVKEYAKTRIRINSLRKNTILPKALQEIADAEIAALPRDSNKIRCVARCAMTSRPRGVVKKWRLSRIVWRHLADYNYLSGVQRAIWG